MTEEVYHEQRVSVSIARKINTGNYESVDLFMAVSNIEPGATDAEILESLATGDRALQLLKNKMQEKIAEARKGAFS